MGNAFGCDACGAEGDDLKPPRSFSLPPTIMRPSGSVPEGWSLGDKLLEFRRGISDSDLDAIDKAELLARFDAEVQLLTHASSFARAFECQHVDHHALGARSDAGRSACIVG
jgi:hypothetical protein